MLQETEPKKDRFETPAAVFIFFIQDNKILLHRRKGTGWQDGNYDVPSGHLEALEQLEECASRESKEEAGLIVDPANINLVHYIHCRFGDYTYFQYYLQASRFDGIPIIMEKDKCDHMDWFDLDALPDNLVPYVMQAIEKVKNGEFYSKYGWE